MNKKYIYDWKKANAFIQWGLCVIEVGCNKGNIYFVFSCNDVDRYYTSKTI